VSDRKGQELSIRILVITEASGLDRPDDGMGKGRLGKATLPGSVEQSNRRCTLTTDQSSYRQGKAQSLAELDYMPLPLLFW